MAAATSLQGSVLSIPNQLIELVVQYLCPPVATPLPSHLLSTPLKQRHHFLALSPADPAEYFCWPSSAYDPHQVIDLLSSTTCIASDSYQPNAIRYRADIETLSAFVPLHNQTLLVFLHDPEDAQTPWKYHDARLLQLPLHAYSTVEEALSRALNSAELETTQSMDGPYDENPSSYWEGFDSSRSASPQHEEPTNTGEGQINGDRDYWSRYTSVQGSADSTIPSPVPEHRHPYDVSPTQRPADYDNLFTFSDIPDHFEASDGPQRSADMNTQMFHPSDKPASARIVHDASVKQSDATVDVLRGLYRMWQIQNPDQGKSDFLSLVRKALA